VRGGTENGEQCIMNIHALPWDVVQCALVSYTLTTFLVLSPSRGNAVKHFSTDFVRVALALPVVCHPITGYDTGKASATQDKYFCQKASQRSPKGKELDGTEAQLWPEWAIRFARWFDVP
jgi:hypothetical protein